MKSSSQSLSDNQQLPWQQSTVFRPDNKASRWKKIVMFLDYDGTLSPFSKDLDRAFISKKMRTYVKRLARCFPSP
ncbi:unnamed protein product [Linum trigynum]|uniref:Uncharacterized protein n=1 Tax=Linum trigynum TaxID=586398 RepID=A0AAV2CYA4_9ROSI